MDPWFWRVALTMSNAYGVLYFLFRLNASSIEVYPAFDQATGARTRRHIIAMTPVKLLRPCLLTARALECQFSN